MVEVLRGTWVIAYRELLRFIQERARAFSSLGMPLLFLIIFGAGFNQIIGALMPNVDFIQFMYPGIICMTVFMNSVFSGLSIVWDREFGFLKEVLVAPLSRVGIILGKGLGAALIAVGQGLVLLILAPILGVRLTPLLIVQLVPLLLLLSLSLSGLGLAVASRMRSQQGFQVMVQLIVFPMVFVSGVFFPVNNVPLWLEVLSKVNPLTYGVDAVRQIVLNGFLVPPSGTAEGSIAAVLGVNVLGHTTTILEDVAIVGFFGMVLMVLAVWSFSRQE
jgi:ABC-2 type transport system permease protein